MKTLTFRVTDEEARRIRLLSKMQKLSISEYLRQQATDPWFEAAAPTLVRCEFTGAMIFAPPPGYPPLNTESMRKMLADFA